MIAHSRHSLLDCGKYVRGGARCQNRSCSFGQLSHYGDDMLHALALAIHNFREAFDQPPVRIWLGKTQVNEGQLLQLRHGLVDARLSLADVIQQITDDVIVHNQFSELIGDELPAFQ